MGVKEMGQAKNRKAEINALRARATLIPQMPILDKMTDVPWDKVGAVMTTGKDGSPERALAVLEFMLTEARKAGGQQAVNEMYEIAKRALPGVYEV